MLLTSYFMTLFVTATEMWSQWCLGNCVCHVSVLCAVACNVTFMWSPTKTQLSVLLLMKVNNTATYFSHTGKNKDEIQHGGEAMSTLCGHLWYMCNSKYLMNAFFPTVVYAVLDLWYLCPVQVSFVFLQKQPSSPTLFTGFNKADSCS